eukprot:TRINITY_DN690_c0_g1_i1.p1 TRINITY_DN690_c0_g1~~TRINITY_DN690_c0_g1_i1.p1  ORF type:complete len:453 (+),score=63.08 TRINITY_DN690_c0_g1_i1:39-1397(+)
MGAEDWGVRPVYPPQLPERGSPGSLGACGAGGCEVVVESSRRPRVREVGHGTECLGMSVSPPGRPAPPPPAAADSTPAEVQGAGTPSTGEMPHPSQRVAGEVHRLKAENRCVLHDNRCLAESNRRLRDEVQALQAEVAVLRAEAQRAAEVDVSTEDLKEQCTALREALEVERQERTAADRGQAAALEDLASYKDLYDVAAKRCERLEVDKAALRQTASDAAEQQSKMADVLHGMRTELLIRTDEADTLDERVLELRASNAILHQRIEAYESHQMEVEMLRQRVVQLSGDRGKDDELGSTTPTGGNRRRSQSGSSAAAGSGRARPAPPLAVGTDAPQAPQGPFVAKVLDSPRTPRNRSGSSAKQRRVVTERRGFLTSSTRGICSPSSQVETVGLNSPRGHPDATARPPSPAGWLRARARSSSRENTRSTSARARAGSRNSLLAPPAALSSRMG